MKRLNYIFLGMMVVTTSCTKNFLDINKDPNQPGKAALSQLLPTAEQGLSASLGFTNDNAGARGLTEVLSVYTHQLTTRENPDGYNATGSNFSIDNSWIGFYSAQKAAGTTDIVGTMQNLEVLITQASASNNKIYAGIGKILKAYGVSQFVDAFGDIPYSEATKFATTGNRYPKFDKGADIYPQLLALLDAGIADLKDKTAANPSVPGDDDLFYGGNPKLWIKAANTIKLKLYNQLRLVQNVSAPVAALLAKPAELISETKEGFMMKYSNVTAPDSRNPGFSEYFASQKGHYMSPWFYEILKGYNKQIFTGIADPRVPYYFFRQIGSGAKTANVTEYRDGGFVSVYFGSKGPNRDWSVDAYLTTFGIYPVGGRYDDGDPKKVDASAGTGAAPLRLLTYADRLYIEAELYNTNVVPGNADATFAAALNESLSQVDYVVGLSKTSQTVPTLSTSPAADAYKTAILALYNAATPARKLEIIMTEKWIQSFGFSCDQYTDYRRTGYPVLFDPANPVQAPGGQVQPPTGEAVKVATGKNYPLSLPWAISELNVNPNAPQQQKQPDVSPVFWDKN